MTLTLKATTPPTERAEPILRHFEPELLVSPPDNPIPHPTKVAELRESIRQHGQLVPGWVCPSPELPPEKRLIIEGNSRRLATQQLGITFWAFDVGRFVSEEDRIKLTFSHNFIRRRMSIEEIAEKASRFMELTGCSANQASTYLNVSPPTLSRAFGERRIPPELKPRADRLVQSVRSLIAAVPETLMAQAIKYAETPLSDDKKPTRDQVSLFIRQLKKDGKPKGRKPKAIPLRLNGRLVSITVGEKDNALTVMEDLKSLASKLGKHAEVPPDGWPFLFQ
jgi:ParB/RepB/Spo0J family partition protein